jgi:DNA polymerase-3 subunit delta
MGTLPLARLLGMKETGEAPPLLLLVRGDCGFLIERAARSVADRVPEDERSMALWRGSAAEADPDRLLDDASTLPMCGERRVLIVREAEKFPLAGHAGWQAYLRRPSPQAVVAFLVTAGADSKTVRALAEACAVVDCDLPSARALPGWLAVEARALGCTLEPGAGAWMVEVAGRDLGALYAWLERCVLYRAGPGRLTRPDLEQVSARRAPANLFTWADRVGERKGVEALRLAQRALEDGEEPLALLGRAASHLRRLALTRRGMAGGVGAGQAARQAGVPSFLAESMGAQARAFPEPELARTLAACAGADRALKSVRVSPARTLDRWLIKTLVPH